MKDLRRLAAYVAENLSPPRVTTEAPRWGLKAGEAMDLLTGWDFRNPEDRRRAWKYLEQHEPKLVIGSPVLYHVQLASEHVRVDNVKDRAMARSGGPH